MGDDPASWRETLDWWSPHFSESAVYANGRCFSDRRIYTAIASLVVSAPVMYMLDHAWLASGLAGVGAAVAVSIALWCTDFVTGVVRFSAGHGVALDREVSSLRRPRTKAIDPRVEAARADLHVLSKRLSELNNDSPALISDLDSSMHCIRDIIVLGRFLNLERELEIRFMVKREYLSMDSGYYWHMERNKATVAEYLSGWADRFAEQITLSTINPTYSAPKRKEDP